MPMLSSFACSTVRPRALVVALGLTFALGGCASNDQPTRPPEESATDSTSPTSVTDDSPIAGTGTIRYVDLEGGFYGLVADDETKYDPTSLPDSLQVDGLAVRFRVREKDVMTTRMWGTPVEVLEIERIDDENQ